VSAQQQDLQENFEKTGSGLELLVLDGSRNEAEAHVAALRNAGFAVHPHVVSELIDFRVSLEEETTDLVICNCSGKRFDGNQIMQILNAIDPDIPSILIADDRNSKDMREAMRKGAHDIVAKGDIELLQIIFSREVSLLNTIRQVSRLRNQLQETEHRCNILIENSRDAIAYIHEGMHIHANPVYLSMFGFVDFDEVEGMPMLDLVDPKDNKIFKKFLRNLCDNVNSGNLEVSCRGTNGKTFDAQIQFSPASIDGEPCTQLIVRDQSREKELEQKVRLLTNHDVDTGLANRQYFIDRLNELLPGFRNGEKGTLIYISLDNMQDIRNKLGGAGNADKFLSEIAELLNPLVEENDFFGRFGDHTFTFYTRKSDKGATGKLASEICARINQNTYKMAPGVRAPTCSIGVTYANNRTSSIQDFIDQAFHACESAREAGGNQWMRFDDSAPPPPDSVLNQLNDEDSILEVIDNALEYNRFRLFFQPIVSLQGDTRENYAVLVRMLNETDEPILPEKFLDRAVQHGRMAAIDRWIIKHAVEELSLQRKNGRKINFFISLSGEALSDDTLLLWICDCLRLYDAKGPWITFQISDRDIRTHVQQTRALVEGLKKIKCNLAIDHFGVTPKYESLLKHLPVDFLKLDPSFMQNLTSDPRKQVLIKEISDLAKSYDVKTIATAVEDANSLAALWTVGINYIQGYFLQEPSDTIGYDFNLG